jgi:hypothetical protein
VIADLDTLLTALYVELTDRIIPSGGFARRGPGKPPEVTDAELVCLAVAQVLLRYDDERHWLRAAAGRVGHLFPRLLRQSEYNERLKALAPLMEAVLRWLADRTRATAEMLRLMDGTPVPCGTSAVAARRSGLYGWAGYGYCPSHSRWYWGAKLLLICTCDGTVTGFGQRTGPRRAPSSSRTKASPEKTSRSSCPAQTSAWPWSARPARMRRHPGTSRTGCGSGWRPGPQRLHLAQLGDRRTGQTLTDRLRPLTCPDFPVNDLGVL